MPPADDRKLMSRALELAQQGRGQVEPNPLVGCVVVRKGQIVGEGWHGRFGGPHAEVEALAAAGEAARGAAVFVTLEPCSHEGQTPPCTQALITAGVGRIVVGCGDPNPEVAGGAIATLRAAGVEVVEGVCEDEARALIAPFEKLVVHGRPWILAKWAMTLDGKLATHTGSSQWISGAASRAVVHKLRGQVDAILIGSGTAQADDPLLTARPAGARTAMRIVLDSSAKLPTDSQLVQTAARAPVLVAVAENAPATRRQRLEDHGVEVLALPGANQDDQLVALLDELGRRRLTNVLVEGGAQLFGALLDLREIDEVHAFVAGKLIGGRDAPSAIAGAGIAYMADAISLRDLTVQHVGDDLHLRGRVRWK